MLYGFASLFVFVSVETMCERRSKSSNACCKNLTGIEKLCRGIPRDYRRSVLSPRPLLASMTTQTCSHDKCNAVKVHERSRHEKDKCLESRRQSLKEKSIRLVLVRFNNTLDLRSRTPTTGNGSGDGKPSLKARACGSSEPATATPRH